MKRTPIRSLFACLSLIFVAGAADAQQHENYCNSLKTLLQSAKDGFAQAQNLKMAGASVCNVENDTRSYGCMWTFDKSPLAAAGYQKAVQAARACFPSITPKQSRSARGTLHTEYDFGKGEPLIDISRGRPGSEEGDWYSIDIIAP
ncbi:MAG: hypothetical protein E6G81_10215 [Alphaproteobacteria bacterium]|nr:MAG: hypothetical protein E6G81_10215 [Alphaproteobacteria bacterium]